MKKIGIFGSYGGASTGDEAILKGLLRLLENSYEKKFNVVIYTANAKVTRDAIKESIESNIEFREFKNNERYTIFDRIVYLSLRKIGKYLPTISIVVENTYRKVFRKPLIKQNIFSDIDVLIFGGGNIIMDLYYKWPQIMDSVIKQFEKENIQRRKNIYFLGVGAGPVNSLFTKKLIKKICQTFYVSTRDIESKTMLEYISNNEINEGNDLAIGLSGIYKNKIKSNIAVSVVPYHADYYWPNADISKYNYYKENLAKILDKVIDETGKKIEFFATNYPNDIRVAKDISNLMKNKESVLMNNNKMNVDELLRFLSSKEFLIGTRLHSLILASNVSTNFFAINYQPKVNNFLNRIEMSENYLDISVLSSRKFNDSQIINAKNKIVSSYNKTQGFDIINNKKELLRKELVDIFKNV